MSIISDALKKVEGNSSSQLPKKQKAPKVEMMEAPFRSITPPLFSVWSIVLSTVMVFAAAVLLLATWFMNRAQNPEFASVKTVPLSSPVEVVAVPSPEKPVTVVPSAADAAARVTPQASESGLMVKSEPKPAEAESPSPAKVEPPVEEKAAVAAVPSPAAVKPVPAVSQPEPPSKPKAPAKRDELVLTGVVYTPRVRMAHINGKILPEGAEIEGYRIVTVSRESVRLSKEDKFYLLRLKR